MMGRWDEEFGDMLERLKAQGWSDAEITALALRTLQNG